MQNISLEYLNRTVYCLSQHCGAKLLAKLILLHSDLEIRFLVIGCSSSFL